MHVSVVIPSFNGEQYIVEAIESVLAQTHVDLDVLVVDDGSTDSTPDLVRAQSDPRVRLIEQTNAGCAAARNRGVAEASGDIVAFLDQDDVWFADKLSCQLPLLDDLAVGIVGALMTYLGDSGRRVGTAGEIADHQQQRIAAARLMPFPPSSMIVRKRVLDEVGGFDAELARSMAPMDDFDLISRVAKKYRIVTFPRPLGYYRIHGNTASFARFYDLQRGTRFLMARADHGDRKPPLTWAAWDRANGQTKHRLDRAKYLYRAAGFCVIEGRPVRGVIKLAGASILAPNYTLRRLLFQLKRPRSVSPGEPGQS